MHNITWNRAHTRPDDSLTALTTKWHGLSKHRQHAHVVQKLLQIVREFAEVRRRDVLRVGLSETVACQFDDLVLDKPRRSVQLCVQFLEVVTLNELRKSLLHLLHCLQHRHGAVSKQMSLRCS